MTVFKDWQAYNKAKHDALKDEYEEVERAHDALIMSEMRINCLKKIHDAALEELQKAEAQWVANGNSWSLLENDLEN